MRRWRPSSPAPRGTLDPAFDKIPFRQWLGERDAAGFRCTARVSQAQLSFHQRLMAGVEITADGRQLESRRGEGKLVFFVQITDRDQTPYQTHGSIELSKLDENVKVANLEYSQAAFFLPGNYGLQVAILDTVTGEHSTVQAQFRVAAPRHNLMPDAWRDLPAIEFIGTEKATDDWYLPGIRGRLQWAAAVRSPVRLNVILNVAPSVTALGSHATPASGLPALIPTLKAISQTGSSSISEQVELLDLARRRVVFHQEDVHELDWPGVKASLEEANTASIDIHSLSQQHHDAQFFVSQVRRLLRGFEGPCVLAVLSTAVAFESGEDLQPISLEALPACRVVYIRYQTAEPSVYPFEERMGGRGRGSRMGGPMNPTIVRRAVVDQLEPTLKPLNPKVFDVQTPEEMTKAIAEIEKALMISSANRTQ